MDGGYWDQPLPTCQSKYVAQNIIAFFCMQKKGTFNLLYMYVEFNFASADMQCIDTPIIY